MNKRIAVIADDLTGANDTGAQFAKIGLRTLVILESTQEQSLRDHDVVVITTDSRALPAQDAYRKVADTAAWIRQRKYDAVYKKIDSTLRGNLGSEIEAIMDVLGCKLALVAPAFPQNGRTTIGGYQLLKGVPIEATEIAQDPKCPVRESNIISLLRNQTKVRVGHLSIQTLLGGADSIRSSILSMHENGIGIVVSDIWDAEQFKLLADGAVATGIDILWVGSAGLAEALPDCLRISSQQPVEEMPILIIAGSVSNVTRKQVECLAADEHTVWVQTDPIKFLTEDKNPHIEECCDTVAKALLLGKDVMITSGYSNEVVELTKQHGDVLGLQPCETSSIVADSLGTIVKMLIERRIKLGGMVLTGGDTAISVCRSLASIGMRVLGEVSPGIPLGMLQGGVCEDMLVVTKAGAFGEQHVLQKAVSILKEYGKSNTKGREAHT